MTIDAQISYGDEDDPVIRVLKRLESIDLEFDFASMVQQWRRWGSFSPRQMLLIQWRLAENRITHKPSCFVVSIRSEKEIAQIRSLDEWRRKKLAPYLSWEQRSKFGF